MEVTIAGLIVYAVVVAALSLCFTMITWSDGFPHLWLVDFMAIGTYASFVSTEILRRSPYLGAPMAFILGGVIGVAFYWAVIRRLHDRDMSPVYMTLGSLGLGCVIRSSLYSFEKSEGG